MRASIEAVRGGLSVLLAFGVVCGAVAGCGGGGSSSGGAATTSPATKSAPATPAPGNCSRDGDGDGVEPKGNDGDGCGV